MYFLPIKSTSGTAPLFSESFGLLGRRRACVLSFLSRLWRESLLASSFGKMSEIMWEFLRIRIRSSPLRGLSRKNTLSALRFSFRRQELSYGVPCFWKGGSMGAGGGGVVGCSLGGGFFFLGGGGLWGGGAPFLSPPRGARCFRPKTTFLKQSFEFHSLVFSGAYDRKSLAPGINIAATWKECCFSGDRCCLRCRIKQ